MTFKVGYFVGSLSSKSINRELSKVLIRLAPDDLEFSEIPIRNLPLYSPDYDASYPPEAVALKEAIHGSQAILFVTPEYNRSVPGLLKNAIDVGSRPYGKSAWEGKPAAVVSVSPGVIGAFGANQALRQSFVFLNMPALQQPEAYIGGAAKLFDDKGELISDSTREFLGKFLQAFAQWIERIAAK